METPGREAHGSVLAKPTLVLLVLKAATGHLRPLPLEVAKMMKTLLTMTQKMDKTLSEATLPWVEEPTRVRSDGASHAETP